MIRYCILSFSIIIFSCSSYHSREKFIYLSQIRGSKITVITKIGCERYFVDCEEYKLRKSVYSKDSILLYNSFNGHLIFGNNKIVKGKAKIGYYKGALLPLGSSTEGGVLEIDFLDKKDSVLYSFKSAPMR